MNTHDVTYRPTARRLGAAATAFGALALALAACSPGASAPTIPSVAVPSVDVSAGASLAIGAAIAALDQVDAAIVANQSGGQLSDDDAGDLEELSGAIRTSLQTGDITAARTAVQNLSTKVDELAAKLDATAGPQLKAAVEALRAAVPTN